MDISAFFSSLVAGNGSFFFDKSNGSGVPGKESGGFEALLGRFIENGGFPAFRNAEVTALDLPGEQGVNGNLVPLLAAARKSGFLQDEESFSHLTAQLESLLREGQLGSAVDLAGASEPHLSAPVTFSPLFNGVEKEKILDFAQWENEGDFLEGKKESLTPRAVIEAMLQQRLQPEKFSQDRSQTVLRQLSEGDSPVQQSQSLAPLNGGVSGIEKSVTLQLARPVSHPEWGRELGERVSWMAGKSVQSAELRLNPARLGPLEVHVQIQNDQASVTIASHHAAVRELLEQAIPRLREMLVAQQFSQVNVDVSQQSFKHSEQQASAGSSGFHSSGENEAEEPQADGASESRVIKGEGLLNYYI